MSGGIGYVLKKILEKGEIQARKGAYHARVEPDKPPFSEFHLTHYGTKILAIDFKKERVIGGWDTKSSSQAINAALKAWRVPCYWSSDKKHHGFSCSGNWKGVPAAPKTLEKLFVPGHQYSNFAKKTVRKVEKQWKKFNESSE